MLRPYQGGAFLFAEKPGLIGWQKHLGLQNKEYYFIRRMRDERKTAGNSRGGAETDS